MGHKSRPHLQVSTRNEGVYVSIIGSKGGVRHTYSESVTTVAEGIAGLEAAINECLVDAGLNRPPVEPMEAQ